MIPQNIQKEHLLSAIQEIDRDGIPAHRQSTRYDLIHEGKAYPPKLVIRKASRIANGREAGSFYGGPETNNFLKKHGFTIRKKSEGASEDEELTLDYSEWVLQRLLEYHKAHPDFYFLTRTNKSEDRLRAGHWFPGSDFDYLQVDVTKRKSGNGYTKSVGFKIDCGGGTARAMLVIMFKGEDEPAIRAFYRDLFEHLKLQDASIEELNHDHFVLPYGTDIAAALDVFLQRDVPIFKALLKKHHLEKTLAVSYDSFRHKLDNVLAIRGETDATVYPTEKRLARLCWSLNGWVAPSGRPGKSKTTEAHEQAYGFGYEEWLLNFDQLIDGYHYGFLQPVFQDWSSYKGKKYDVTLFARDAKEEQRYWIGEIQNVEVIDEVLGQTILDKYKENGWLKKMKDQIAALGLKVSALGAYSSNNFFNIRFKPADYKPLPELQPFTDADEAQVRSKRYKFFKAENIELPDKRELPDFAFSPGAPTETGDRTITRTFQPRVLELPDRHKKIIDGLYIYLKEKYGDNNVRSELPTRYGASRIDMAVQEKEGLVFYEVKTYNLLRDCIRIAIGQLLEYCYWPDHERAIKMVLVTPHPVDEKTGKYFRQMRERTGLNLYCAQFDENSNRLVQS